MIPLLLSSTLALAVTTPTPNLDIDGACPGPMTVHVDHASANARVALVRAAGPGTFVIPSGRCAGVDVGLAAPSIAVTGRASAGGEVTWTPTLTAPACGQWLVAIDLDTCRASAPMPVTPPPTDRWDITLDLPSLYGANDVARDTSWVVNVTDPAGGTGIVHVDDTGTVLSSVTTGVAVTRLLEGPSGVFAVGAESFDPALAGHGFAHPLVLNLNGVLQPTWASMFDDLGDFSAGAVGPNGELYAAGTMEALVDTSGAVTWTASRTWFGRINAAAAGPSGFFTVGWAWRNGNGEHDATLFRVAPDGATRWGERLSRLDHTSAHVVLPLGEESLVLLADATDPGMTLVRLDAAGAVMWSQMYTAPSAPYLSCSDIVPAWAGYALVCTTWDAGFNVLDTVLIKVDTEGDVQYARTYGPGWLGGGHVAGHLGMVLAGSDITGAARLIRVDANGQTGCDQPYNVIGAPVVVTATPEPPAPPPLAPPLSHPNPVFSGVNVSRYGVCR